MMTCPSRSAPVGGALSEVSGSLRMAWPARLASLASRGVRIIVVLATSMKNCAVCADTVPLLRASASTTKTNSPAWPSSSAVSAAVSRFTRKAMKTANRIAAFSTITASATPSSQMMSSQIATGSIPIPTVMKKSPRSSPRNGSISTSI